MDNEYLRLLFEKYIQKTATAEEREALLQHIAQLGDDDVILKQISDEVHLPEHLPGRMPENASRQVLEAIFKLGDQPAALKGRVIDMQALALWNRKGLRYAAAAMLIFMMISAGWYFFPVKRSKDAPAMLTESRVIRDAMPGKSGALLTLSNGKSFLLDTLGDGTITGGLVKASGVVTVNGAEISETYATVSTPAGRQQQLQLSDGTKVWLNAGSSIRFPAVFSEKERIVDVTGEVYIEVVHDDAKPFIVKTGTDEIRDIGTKFNINAYRNEPASRITLVEGSIEINRKVVLKPSEQYTAGKVKTVNADASIAWVSGYFDFEHADIQTVMRQIARWYDVDVHYAGEIPHKQFEGQIQRSLKLSEVLELLSNAGIKYLLDGNKLTISQ
ncbi:FecR family protein [Chitinophaga sp. 212800010-3]|uniref:FecR family protein n=1 Tax=unclassified Chitinophaga TaxID=2619133 RepID=UPI002DF416BF|nr:hypothetical protein [Chitinophaga sp. 212800010-3]